MSARIFVLSAVLAACGDAGSPAADAAPADAAIAGDFGVNDVSLLFPLPANDAARVAFLWLVPGAGEQGPYFPPDAVDQLPPMNADLPIGFGYPSAMVTSIRFDPCFPRLGGPQCQAQLRLVAQPVLTSPAGVQMLDDAAGHLFYALTATEADVVIAALAAIRDGSPVATAGPLAVHPGLAVDVHGSTGAAVRQLVVDHCRDDNLVRITFNSFAMDNWGFGRFDRDAAGTLVRQPLIGMVTSEPAQAWLRQASTDDLDDPSGTISPAPLDGFTYLLSSTSFAGGGPVDAGRAAAAATRLLAIENPTLTSTEDVDCASCHLATQARLFAARNAVDFTGPSRYQPPAGVDTTLILAPDLGGNLGATISFGWHSQDNTGTRIEMPSISQRTINESAEIAVYLASR